MVEEYKNALKDILHSDELQRILANTTVCEKRKIKQYVQAIKMLENKGMDINDMSIIPLVHQNDSPMLWKEIFYFMMASEERNKDDLK